MSDLKDWPNLAATTPASPNDVTPHWMPEGDTAVAKVNDWGREAQAAIRRYYENLEWRDFGHTATYDDATHFDLTPGGAGLLYNVGQRIRVSDGSGTLYTTIIGIATDKIEIADNLTSPVTAVAVGIDPTNKNINVTGVHNAASLAVPSAAGNIAELDVGGDLQDSGVVISTDNTLGGATASNLKVPTEKAVYDFLANTNNILAMWANSGLDGADGVHQVTGPETPADLSYHYSIFEMNNGTTLTPSEGAIIIYASTSIELIGTAKIDCSGATGGVGSIGAGGAGGAAKTGAGAGNNGFDGFFGGTGGGGGNSGGANGGNAGDAYKANGGLGATAINADGANGLTLAQEIYRMFYDNPGMRGPFINSGKPDPVELELKGGSGGGSGGNVLAVSGGAGGSGGGDVILISPAITISATASIDCSGEDGAAPGATANGGGGGGGGGRILLITATGGLTDNSSGAAFDVTGGTGGVSTSGGDGGDGGAGKYEHLELL